MSASEFNCDVCYKDLKKHARNKPSTPFIFCTTCNFVMCVKCLGKIQASDSAHQCPQCKIWTLSGEEYGLPRDELDLALPQDFQELPLTKKIESILKKLDGFTMVIARRDSAFVSPKRMCRLSYTDRYQHYSDSPASIAKYLESFYVQSKKQNPACIVRFYIARQTYKINKETNAPIEETSAFKIVNTRDIRQYAPDAWINTFGNDDNFEMKQVAYIPPYEYTLPKIYNDVTIEIAKFDCSKTINIVHETYGKMRVVANFDVSRDNIITTINQTALTAMIVDSHENNPDKVYVTARLFPYDDDSQTADLVTYAYTKSNSDKGFERVDPATSRKLFNDNIDELKRSKFIKKFL